MRLQTRRPALALAGVLTLGLPVPAAAALSAPPRGAAVTRAVPIPAADAPAVAPLHTSAAVTRIRRAAADLEAAGERLVEERASLGRLTAEAAGTGAAWGAASARYRDVRGWTVSWARRSYAVLPADRTTGDEVAALAAGSAGELRAATQAYAEAHLAEAAQRTVTERLRVRYARSARALTALRASHRTEVAAADARQEARDAALSRTILAGLALTGGTPAPAALRALRYALAQLGKPYVWGDEGPAAFDCSGLVQSAYAAAGVVLPRTARPQYLSTTRIPVRALLPGDLLFFGPDRSDWNSIHHVAIYLGGGRMVHAPTTGDVVRIAPVWWEEFFGATRVVGAAAATVPGAGHATAPGAVRPHVPGPPRSPVPSPVPSPVSTSFLLSVPSASPSVVPSASASSPPPPSPPGPGPTVPPSPSPSCPAPTGSPSPPPTPDPGCNPSPSPSASP